MRIALLLYNYTPIKLYRLIGVRNRSQRDESSALISRFGIDFSLIMCFKF